MTCVTFNTLRTHGRVSLRRVYDYNGRGGEFIPLDSRSWQTPGIYGPGRDALQADPVNASLDTTTKPEKEITDTIASAQNRIDSQPTRVFLLIFGRT